MTATATRTCVRCGADLPTDHGNRKYCSAKCRRRAWNVRSRCECGEPKAPSARSCLTCLRAAQEERRELLWGRIEELWAEGASLKEVARDTGVSEGSLAPMFVRMRAAGRDLPYRRTGGRKQPQTKRQCQQQLASSIHYGHIRRASRCEKCGEVAHTDGHHTDYSRPLYVVWLCRGCHLDEHGRSA